LTGELGDAGRAPHAGLGEPLKRCRDAVKADHGRSAVAREVAAHGFAHDAEADEADGGNH